jgi:mRNA interferase YafQ
VAKAKPKAQPAEVPLAPLALEFTKQFGKDAARQEKRGKSMAKLHTVVEMLRTHRPLEAKHANHPLSGKWKGAWDCHIEPDWVLIYVRTPTKLRLMRTGSHSDLFE